MRISSIDSTSAPLAGVLPVIFKPSTIVNVYVMSSAIVTFALVSAHTYCFLRTNVYVPGVVIGSAACKQSAFNGVCSPQASVYVTVNGNSSPFSFVITASLTLSTMFWLNSK